MAKAGAGAGGGKGGKGGGGGDAKDDKGEHGLGVTPINYLKDGKDPSVMPDESYPDWLWNMQVRRRPLFVAAGAHPRRHGGLLSGVHLFSPPTLW